MKVSFLDALENNAEGAEARSRRENSLCLETVRDMEFANQFVFHK